jgi:CheY-like chemotaxis protein
MGGAIWATSRVGRGSSFFASIQVTPVDGQGDLTPGQLPFSKELANLAQRTTGARRVSEQLPLKIVAADNDNANQRILSIMLRRLGWEAEFKGNGEELITYLTSNHCDLVFMDLEMPVMDGFEATTLIRNGAAGDQMENVKIIGLAANASALSQVEARCIEVGMNACLSRPLKVTSLEKKILGMFPLT